MVNVTKANFVQASEDVLKHLKTASYIAIDLEMSGISLPGQKRPPKDDTPEQRYQRLKKIPELYSIIQVGISLFHRNQNYDSQRQLQENGDDSNNIDGSEEAREGAPEPEYIARPYNFYIFPPSSRQARDVTLSPAAVQFLNGHGMEFGTWIKDGVGYLNTQQASDLIAKIEAKLVSEDQQQGHNGTDTMNTTAAATTPEKNNHQSKIVLTRTQDIQFVGRVTAAVREWIDNAIPHDRMPQAADNGPDLRHASSFVLPPCNAFLRRALYETLREAYPSLILEKGEGPQQKDCIVVHRLSEEEKKLRENEKKRKDIEELKMTIGFYRVFRAISDASKGIYDPQEDELGNVNYLLPQKQKQPEILSRNNAENEKSKEGGIPVIVHNGFMDLLFLMTHFHEAVLPDTWEEAKSLVHGYFPIIFDTKCLAEEFSPLTYKDTTVGDMFSFWEVEDRLLKRVQLAPEFQDRYTMVTTSVSPDDSTVIIRNTAEKSSGAHEAGYDAFMTGALYYYISSSIISHHTTYTEPNAIDLICVETFHKRNNTSSGINKLLCYGTVYNLDLANTQDPFKKGFHPRGIFRVCLTESTVNNRDINAALFAEERLKYEVMWVDDVTFLIVAKTLDNSTDSSSYDETVGTIYDKLKARFGSNSVTTFEQRLKEGTSYALRSKIGSVSDLVNGMISYFRGTKSSIGGESKKRKRSD